MVELASRFVESKESSGDVMQSEVRTVYAVVRDYGADDYEVKYAFFDFDIARNVNQTLSADVSGGVLWSVKERRAIVVDGFAHILANFPPIKVNRTPTDEAEERSAALAKLTIRECELLGLKK